MQDSLKSHLGRLALRVGAHRACLRNTATIVAFHRIDESASHDAITVSPESFESFCKHAADYFDVQPLPTVLERISTGASLSRLLAITFDDGYADNFSTAAPTLARYSLPATFFIATDMIGTRTQPEWDRKAGVDTRWMTWSQVRELHRQGFDIGAHTKTHADLASLTSEEARAEIAGSRKHLEQELGMPIRLFSYPFGSPAHCNDSVRQIVQDLDFACCLSCHGGLVRPEADLFDLPRVPINNYYRDFWHFGAALLKTAARR